MDYIFFLTGYDQRYIEAALPDACQPVRYMLTITEEVDLLTKVVKSKTASVEIPELEIRILPGSNSKNLICDVFGLLSRIEDAIKMGRGIENTKTKELLEKLGQIKNGRLTATLVLTDPSGLSLINGAAIKEPLNT